MDFWLFALFTDVAPEDLRLLSINPFRLFPDAYSISMLLSEQCSIKDRNITRCPLTLLGPMQSARVTVEDWFECLGNFLPICLGG